MYISRRPSNRVFPRSILTPNIPMIPICLRSCLYVPCSMPKPVRAENYNLLFNPSDSSLTTATMTQMSSTLPPCQFS